MLKMRLCTATFAELVSKIDQPLGLYQWSFMPYMFINRQMHCCYLAIFFFFSDEGQTHCDQFSVIIEFKKTNENKKVLSTTAQSIPQAL
jgi:hypothetical protein